MVTSNNPSGGAAAWKVTNTDGTSLNGVSCPSVSLCVAVDNVGEVFTSSNPIGGMATWKVTKLSGAPN